MGVPQGVLSIPHLRWAFSMLLSRLVRLPAWSSAEALVPWADMMNHDCRATSHLDYDPSSGTVCLEACQAYRPGEQVSAAEPWACELHKSKIRGCICCVHPGCALWVFASFLLRCVIASGHGQLRAENVWTAAPLLRICAGGCRQST